MESALASYVITVILRELEPHSTHIQTDLKDEHDRRLGKVVQWLSQRLDSQVILVDPIYGLWYMTTA